MEDVVQRCCAGGGDAKGVRGGAAALCVFHVTTVTLTEAEQWTQLGRNTYLAY